MTHMVQITVVENDTHEAYLMREANTLDVMAVSAGWETVSEKGELSMLDWCRTRDATLVVTGERNNIESVRTSHAFIDPESYIIFRLFYGEAGE